MKHIENVTVSSYFKSAFKAQGNVMNSLLINRLAFSSIFFSGFASLIDEVVWQRYLANLLGSDAKSTSLVLAIFLGGLALGYKIFGNLTNKKPPRSLFFLCGLAEVAIGIWAVFFPTFFYIAENLLGVVNPEAAYSIFYEILTCIALMGLPTVLMGCTLPLLTQGLSIHQENVPRTHALIYTMNTTGAFLGCLIAGFILLPQMGLPVTITLSGIVSTIAGTLLVRISHSVSSLLPEEKNAPVEYEHENTFSTKLKGVFIAFMVGFTAISLQTVLIRVAGITLGSSDYTFTVIVAIYILMIALGASQVGKLKNANQRNNIAYTQAIVIFGLSVLYIVIPYLPYLFLLVRTVFSLALPAFYAYYVSSIIILGLILFIPLVSLGKMMPLLVGYFKPEVSDSGNLVGRLYSSNSIGCILGALVGGYFLLFYINLDSVLKVIIIISLFTLFINLGLIQSDFKSKKLIGGLSLLLGLGLVFIPAWNNNYMGMGLFRTQVAFPGIYSGVDFAYRHKFGDIKIIARRDDPNTSVAIGESNTSNTIRNIFVNGKSDGATHLPDIATTRLLAHLPMLLSRSENNKVAVIGFGTGITAGTLSLYPAIQEIHCFEISPAVRDFSRYFSFIDHDITHNPKFHWHTGDAYRFLSASPTTYRLIISEPSNPWVAGVERLYTLEFYERAKKYLDENSIFAQWFHMYSISDETLAMVFNTFTKAFPYTRLFSVLNSADIILLGSNSPIEIDNNKLFLPWQNSQAIKNDLKEININTPTELLSYEVLFPMIMFKDSTPLHTLNFPRLSFAAGKDFFQNKNINLEDLLKIEVIRPWVNAYFPKTLLSKWLNKPLSNERDDLTEIARSNCNQHKVEFFQGWDQSNSMCRWSLAALAAKNYISPAPYLRQDDILTTRYLMGLSPQTKPKEIDIATAEKTIQIFNFFNSPLLPLKASSLLDATKACWMGKGEEAALCHILLTQVLISHGFLDDAKKQLHLLTVNPDAIKILTPKVRNDLENGILLSEEAKNGVS